MVLPLGQHLYLLRICSKNESTINDPVACSLPPMYKSTFSQYCNASVTCKFVLVRRIHITHPIPRRTLPNLASYSILTQILLHYLLNHCLLLYSNSVSQAQVVAFPNGGCPSSVGKYFSTSGNTIGKCFLSIICGKPFT